MAFDNNFFLNLDIEDTEANEDNTIQQIFQNELVVLSRDNSNYVKKLKEQLKLLDQLEQNVNKSN